MNGLSLMAHNEVLLHDYIHTSLIHHSKCLYYKKASTVQYRNISICTFTFAPQVRQKA